VDPLRQERLEKKKSFGTHRAVPKDVRRTDSTTNSKAGKQISDTRGDQKGKMPGRGRGGGLEKRRKDIRKVVSLETGNVVRKKGDLFL